ncbi:MAG: class I SAM-dependent methyltransferase [Candidatus Omnitrophica bacterium]|nr:class I SAM-dependent methyltransferase [Candidatus Omnitrophota bacterium]
MNKCPELNKLKKFYNERYDQYGHHIKSVGWGSVESQELRFKVLSQIADLSGKRICDVGCGLGDLYPYLKKCFKNVDYMGIDISEKLIERARECFPKVQFEIRDILDGTFKKKFDFVLASGTLSYKMKNHKVFVEAMLKAMMRMSNKGVAVNFLSSYVDYKLEKNFHFSPEEALALGKTLTPYVTIRHDYPLYEFTMYLYHAPQKG